MLINEVEPINEATVNLLEDSSNDIITMLNKTLSRNGDV